ncbi:hypothetical protein TPChic_0379a [Treponema pallidum subsp. pallidum str. Chicago]|nr:hypothetical protein TPChic_0379a [Treponema pallidum subsp. pallidum str. Chicago]
MNQKNKGDRTVTPSSPPPHTHREDSARSILYSCTSLTRRVSYV